MSALHNDVTSILKRGSGWWTGELRSLLPGVLKRQPGDRTPDAILAVAQDGSASLSHGRNRAGQAASDERDAWQALRLLVQRRPNAAIGLRLANSACFTRRVEIPSSARHQAASILALDLERATPFKAKDVYTAHYLLPSSRKGWLTACQLITKRSTANRWIADIEAAGAMAVRIDCWAEDEKTPVLVNFLNTTGPEQPATQSGFWTKALAICLAAVLALSAAGITIARHEGALLTLESKVGLARAAAKASRQTRDELEAQDAQSAAILDLRAGRPAAVDAIDNLTRLLPDTVSLTSLKIDGNTVEISGLAKQAAAVIPILERSEMYKDAALTAPMTFDSTENKERFGLRAKFRSAHEAPPETPQKAAP